MGVDYHGIHFLSYVKENYGDFGFSITLGRQGLYLDQNTLQIFGINDSRFLDEVSETILNSKKMDSLDFSDYEGANIVHDLNLPIQDNLIHRYDTVIDFGTTEHIFNVPQVLDNCSNLIKVGGKIIHILPSNNFNGHGFYQFSPELFYSYYSEANGFNTEVFLAETTQLKSWLKLSKPTDGNRLEINGIRPMYIMVVAKKEFIFENKIVQQSDYVFNWGNENSIALKHIDKNFSLKFRLRKILVKILHFFGLIEIITVILKCIGFKKSTNFERHLIKKRLS
jgi:hypothetical protein